MILALALIAALHSGPASAPSMPVGTTTTAAQTPGAEALPASDILETIRPVALNNGLCWTATSYAQGAQPFETACGSAHFWVYDLTSTRLYLSGHYTTSIADYGGTVAFRNEPTTGVNSDAVKFGNNNEQYFELTLGTASSGIYIHSNGDNHVLGIDHVKGDGANYYWFENV
jgi:hypothetical protein